MGYKVEYKCTEDNKLRITKKLETTSNDNKNTDEVSFDVDFRYLIECINEASEKSAKSDIEKDENLISRTSAALYEASSALFNSIKNNFSGGNEATKIKIEYEEKLNKLWLILETQNKIKTTEGVDTNKIINKINTETTNFFSFLKNYKRTESSGVAGDLYNPSSVERNIRDFLTEITPDNFTYENDGKILDKLKSLDGYLTYALKGICIANPKGFNKKNFFNEISLNLKNLLDSYKESDSYENIKSRTESYESSLKETINEEIINKRFLRQKKVLSPEKIEEYINNIVNEYGLELDTNTWNSGTLRVKDALDVNKNIKASYDYKLYKTIKTKSDNKDVSATDILDSISRNSNKDLSNALEKIFGNGIKELQKDNRNLVIHLRGDTRTKSIASIDEIINCINNTINILYNASEISDTSVAKNIEDYFYIHKQALISSLDAQGGFESFVEVDNYADYYTTMTPYVQLRFPTSESSDGEFSIDTVNYPFIKSLKMTDNGAKKFTIVLYDRDFNSVVYDKNNKPIGSLDLLLAGALGINQLNKKENDKIEEEDLEAYNFDRAAEFGDIKGMKFNEGSSNIQKANLYIKYGYADVNPPIKGYVDETIKMTDEKGESGYYYAGNTLYSYDNKETKNSRNARWWDTSTEIAPDTNKTIDVRSRSVNPTTSRNSTVKTLITGYKTRFTSAGVYYTIEAIEFTSERLSKYKIFQRYTNIVGTPKEVLYTVMNLLDGLFDDLSFYLDDSLFENVKHVTDEKDESGKKNKIETITGIYEEEEEQEQEDGTIKLVKKPIQISLGSKDAVSMYNAENSDDIAIKTLVIKKDVPKLYKSVASILNELCAAMPPRPESTGAAKDVYTQDQDGNTKKVIEQEEKYRKFTYSIVAIKDDNGRDTGKSAIYFYYQKPTKFEKIRRYTWGPGNSENTVIKDVDINTENEYALLSSMKSITADDNGSYTKQIKSRDGYSVDTKAEGKKALAADYIYQPYESKEASKIRMALSYSQCLYKGTITILGDPFYTFDNYVKPFTYPIYIDFKIPRSEIQFYNDNYNASTKSWGSKQKIGYSHFMSGFYVITSIEHNITTDGFVTTLGVMSYPNLANDIV